MRLSLAIVSGHPVSASRWALGPPSGGCGRCPGTASPSSRAPVRPSPEAPGPGEPAPKVVVDQEEYDFGTMDYGSEMGHDFMFTNAGQAPLVLTAGPTSCRCTVSEVNDDKLLPGESFKVTVRWKAREVSNRLSPDGADLHQRSPPARGQAVDRRRSGGCGAGGPRRTGLQPAFPGRAGQRRSAPAVQPAPSRLKILDYRLSDQDLAKFFQVSCGTALGGRTARPKRRPQRRIAESHRQTGVASRGISTDNPP